MSLLSRLTASSSLVAWIVVHTQTNFPTDRSVVISVFIGLKMHQIASLRIYFQNFSGGGCPRTPLGGRLRHHLLIPVLPETSYNYSRNAPGSWSSSESSAHESSCPTSYHGQSISTSLRVSPWTRHSSIMNIQYSYFLTDLPPVFLIISTESSSQQRKG